MIEQITLQSWTEARDKWYVNTLAEAGCHPTDILQGNWQDLGISVRVDIQKEEEILCIKGVPVGEPFKLHPEMVAKIIYDYNKSKIILPDGTNNN